MKTLVTSSVREAASYIRSGKLVAFPTETVYGLGADATSDAAVDRIFVAKGRPRNNPLIIHVADPDDIVKVAGSVSPAAKRIIKAFFPGPITVVLPGSPRVSSLATADLPTIAVRVPSPEVTRAFLREAGTPVAAPSANRSGRPSPTTVEAVLADLEGRIECVLDGPRSPLGVESTVVDCTEDIPVLLRPGAITLEALSGVVPTIRSDLPSPEALARSPGTRHRHYAPMASVYVIESPHALPMCDRAAGYIGLDPPREESELGLVLICNSVSDYAHALYDFFRRCDANGLRSVYCQDVPDNDIGRAVRDRIHRAMKGEGA